MSKYKILHISSGSYLRNSLGEDLTCNTRNDGMSELSFIFNAAGRLNWNIFNKHIGRAFSYEEFEIIEIEK